MKKVLAVMVAVLLLSLSVLGVYAETTTADNHKDSHESYVGKGNLKVKKELVFGFDSIDDIFNPGNNKFIDTSNQKEGDGCLHVNFDGSSIETKTGAFNFSIKDTRRETVKLWVYISNIDDLACDHDGVYATPQKGSGTINFSFAESDATPYKYKLQHTLEGNGWHLVEIAFNTHNNIYEEFKNTDLSNVGWMGITASGNPNLKFKFDALTKYTYSNDGYVQPEAPNKGRWVSTCDYDALDGSILTEWYASSFDLNEKTQGSSALTLTGRFEHVDFRAVWGGLNLPLNRQSDVFHFDIYISDLKLIGSNLQARLSHCETGSEGAAQYSFDFALANSCAKAADGSKGLKEGWNSVDIPLMLMKYKIDNSYYKNGIDFVLDHIVFFWEGFSTTEYYTVKYDNMYLYDRANATIELYSNKPTNMGLSDEKIKNIVDKIAADASSVNLKSYSEEDVKKITEKFAADYPTKQLTINEDGTLTVTEKTDDKDNMMMYVIIGAAALVVVIIIVIIAVVASKGKKKKAVKPAAAAEAPEETEKEKTEE